MTFSRSKAVALVFAAAVAVCHAARTDKAGVDYFAPAKQSAAPKVEWTRSTGSTLAGLKGRVFADSAGSAYLTDTTMSGSTSVMKYDAKGNRAWTKKLSTSATPPYPRLAEGPKGEVFVLRQVGNATTMSRLMPDGALKQTTVFPKSTVAVIDLAVDDQGGWVSVDTRQKSGDASMVEEYLDRYSAQGQPMWSTFLREMKPGPLGDSADFTSSIASIALDSQGNTYLFTLDVALSGISNARLKQFRPDGKPSWVVDVPPASESTGMITDAAGDIYVVRDQAQGGYCIARYDSSGKEVWTRCSPAAFCDGVGRPSSDKDGNIYVPCRKENSGGFVAKHDASGQLLWKKQLPKITWPGTLAVTGQTIYVEGNVPGKGEQYLVKLAK